MTSLPVASDLPKRLRDNPHAMSAYNICLTRERELADENVKDIKMDLIYIRILGYLLIYAPTDKAVHTLCLEIVSAEREATGRGIFEVGKIYFNHYVRAFRSNKGRTPVLSNHASRPSFDTIADMINDTLEEAPQSRATAKRKALIRDGFRCIITGKYDTNGVLTVGEVKARYWAEPSQPGLTITECTHVFPESTNANIEPGSDRRMNVASMWAIMQRFGYTELPDELKGSNIHRLENVMTIEPGFHSLFDALQVWLVATDTKNKYRIEAIDPILKRGFQLPEFVTFTTDDPRNYPVTSPDYLAIHAACAPVAHLSGAAACIDKFYRDLDDSTTLDPNGASAELLEHAIAKLQIAGYPVAA